MVTSARKEYRTHSNTMHRKVFYLTHTFLVKIVNHSIMKIRRILISYAKLDHTLYSINYGTEYLWLATIRHYL